MSSRHSLALRALVLVSLGLASSAAAAPLTDPATHPRPDFRRERIESLDGDWSFAFDPGDQGTHLEWFLPGKFPRDAASIRVPFPWQAPLSGVADPGYQGVAWYGRLVSSRLALAPGERLFLRFGAVDHEARVFADGKEVASHVGGYLPFECDVTEAFAGDRSAFLVVRASDTTDRRFPGGKQFDWYTPTGGIWQSVWLEARGAAWIDSFRATTPDLAAGAARFEARVAGTGAARLRVTVGAAAAEAAVADGAAAASVAVANARLWSPDDPFLHDAALELLAGDGTVLDRVETQIGYRTIGRGKVPGAEHEAVLLNGEPVYLRGALHQSFNPGGVYTAPDGFFLARDVAIAKECGLNFLRIHIKADDPRLYYWADRLGVLLMCDMPNFAKYCDEGKAEFEKTLEGVIARDFNHPSIFSWCVFNETWGLEQHGTKEGQEWVRALWAKAKSLDPTRLVEDNSPCNYDHVATDLNSWHFYINDWKAAEDHIAEVVAKTAPGSAFNYVGGNVQGTEPLINSEYGGIGAFSGDQDVAQCLLFLTNALRRHEKITGYVYTELCDIEWEHNGLVDYDRGEKEFGYGDLFPGMTLRDVLGEDFVVLDGPPVRHASPGDEVAIAASFSGFSKKAGEKAVLSWQAVARDASGGETPLGPPVRTEFAAARFRVVPAGEIRLRIPPGRLLVLVRAHVESLSGEILARNVVAVDSGRGGLPRAEAGASEVALRFDPCDVADVTFASVELSDEKLSAPGAGAVEYRLRIPEGLDLDAIASVAFLAELSSRAAPGSRVDWPSRRTPHDHPQTERARKTRSAVRVSLNGVPLGDVVLSDDPADARGVLSPTGGYHPGSYGKLARLGAEAAAVVDAIRRDGAFRLRLETLPPHGGLAVFGDGLGASPVDPTLRLALKPGAAPPALPNASLADRLSLVTLVESAPRGGAAWRFTTADPGPSFADPAFDDAAWTEGRSGFGAAGTPGAILGAEWATSDIWLRTRVRCERAPRLLFLSIHHDEDVEVFVNGQPLFAEKGYTTAYREVTLPPEAAALFKPGENVIAVRCRQTRGGQYVDLGIRALNGK